MSFESDKYEDGVYYDKITGDFCTFSVTNDEVEVCDLSGNTYTTYASEDLSESDYTRVEDSAVENPVSYLTSWVDSLCSWNIEELTNISVQEQRSIYYAWTQTTLKTT